MAQKKKKDIIRTDKWQLIPAKEQWELMGLTVKEYRRLCRYLTTIISTHWPALAELSSNEVTPAVERLFHATAQNPEVKYPQIGRAFHKFPSYYRRAAISFAYGQVSSFYTRYRDWQGGIRQRRDAKPPGFNSDAGCYPALYKGQCYKLHGTEAVEIKVFTGKDWVWTTIPISQVRVRHTVETNKQLSPSLILNHKSCHLSVPFRCKPEKREGVGRVLSVDQGLNTTVTAAIVSFDGTVIHSEFIHPGRDIDRRDKRLKSISKKAAHTMGKKGKLHKGFCSNTYRKCRNINRQIGHSVSNQLVKLAEEWQVDAIVLEDLKGWKPRGGKKRSNLRQRFHGWLKGLVHDLTRDKWAEKGGKTIDVIAAYTSKLAFDGSGEVKRNRKNYALATFQNGKQYNADLNGAYNIAARGINKLTGRNDRQLRSGKSSRRKPRSWACLCDVWNKPDPNVSMDTPHLKAAA